MKTYATHFRYVVQYLAAGNKQPMSSFPMATFLSNRCQHYRRVSARSKAEHSWQVLDSKSRWIHWYVRQVSCYSPPRNGYLLPPTLMCCYTTGRMF